MGKAKLLIADLKNQLKIFFVRLRNFDFAYEINSTNKQTTYLDENCLKVDKQYKKED